MILASPVSIDTRPDDLGLSTFSYQQLHKEAEPRTGRVIRATQVKRNCQTFTSIETRPDEYLDDAHLSQQRIDRGCGRWDDTPQSAFVQEQHSFASCPVIGASAYAESSSSSLPPLYICPICGLGNFPSMELARDHCRGQFGACMANDNSAYTNKSKLVVEDPAQTMLPGVTYACPVCNQDGLESFEEALKHCNTSYVMWQPPGSFDAPADTVSGSPLRETSFIKDQSQTTFAERDASAKPEHKHVNLHQRIYRCPSCGERCESFESAIAHCSRRAEETSYVEADPSCRDNDDETQDLFACPICMQNCDSPEIARSHCAHLPGEAVAYDSRGRPIISREVDEQIGCCRTWVLNEDGTIVFFGDDSLASIAKSGECERNAFMENLSQQQLRGLVHEIGQRLVSRSSMYQSFKTEWERRTTADDHSFFGFSGDFTEKELDAAHRRLARQMHPDKNGGTDEAKELFQDMQKRYERLKTKLAEASAPANAPAKAKQEVKYDPTDRTSLLK
eukprot:CAMPEP_0169219616 /NCGR_PEP_ID=MMETSP1016-20121227/20070_1 /TAXON_ID=342587 /ORGANISM="Karlodinium micrum, Strain CCMP2283" /LENGTH=505 /DNA_ID=CAMNT_0009297689 /DNA_START=93 /DNA_END=1607 /DNA_ORIENTATION=+